MTHRLIRFSTGEESTLGLWFSGPDFVCFTLEDERRAVKVAGETRIPAGRYRLKKWTHPDSKFNKRAARHFPEIHRGFVIEIADVPNFEAALVHWGNDSGDTEGCVLVGDSVQQNVTKNGFVGASRQAYERWYPPIADALEADEDVWLQILDAA